VQVLWPLVGVLLRRACMCKAREMVLTGDIYKLDQLPPGSIANMVAEPQVELEERVAREQSELKTRHEELVRDCVRTALALMSLTIQNAPEQGSQ
jgi:hypothetical protein